VVVGVVVCGVVVIVRGVVVIVRGVIVVRVGGLRLEMKAAGMQLACSWQPV
jgi:hypothetical protein